jgi:hypothetical protein
MEPDTVSAVDEFLKNVGHNDEEVGGNHVPLSKPLFASNPTSRNTVEHHYNFAISEDEGDLGTPPFIKTMASKKLVQTFPGN